MLTTPNFVPPNMRNLGPRKTCEPQTKYYLFCFSQFAPGLSQLAIWMKTVFFSKLPTEQASFPANQGSLPHITYVLAISPHLTKSLSPVRCSHVIPARAASLISSAFFFSSFSFFFFRSFSFLQALFYLLCMCRCNAATAPTPHILLLCLTYQNQPLQ